MWGASVPKQQIERNSVLDAALDIVRQEGEAALSARTLAARVGCSVQPIYSQFGDMATLAEALYEHARQWVSEYNRAHTQEDVSMFKQNGLSHLRLAQEEPHLFRFLYLSSHLPSGGFEEIFKSISLDGVMDFIQERGHLSEQDAYELYLNMMLYTQGIATMILCGARFSEEELSVKLDQAFQAFLSQIERR